jgi:regulatory protein
MRRTLDEAGLNRLALAYVGRYATTQKKLSDYLMRKVRESDWADEHPPPISNIVNRMVTLNYVDDAAFAAMKGESLTRRGYGPLRVKMALRNAGIGSNDASDAQERADDAALESALAYAKKRKIGPFSVINTTDPKLKAKALASMCRAGHSYEVAARIVGCPPGAMEDDNRCD